MKKLILTTAICFSVLCFKHADAQLSISINIGTQPTWGPTGYDHVDYYYLPDIDCYYYVPSKKFIYLSGGQWIWSVSLPAQYRSYDLYNGYKIVVNQHRPYLQNNVYRAKYASYKGRRGQTIIRDSHDPKYRPGNRPGNNRPPVRPQPKPKPTPGRPGNGHRPPVKPQPKPTPSRPGNGHRPPVKPQPKPSHPGGDKGHKDDHRK